MAERGPSKMPSMPSALRRGSSMVPEGEVDACVLVAVGSDPIRWRIAMGLRTLDFAVVEAVNVADVLNTLGRIRIPDAFIIDAGLDQGQGIRLAIGLAGLPKTRDIPITLFRRQQHGARDPVLNNLPNTISLIELSSLDEIVGGAVASVKHTLYSCTEGDPTIPEEFEELPEVVELEPLADETSMSDKASAVDKALAMFNDIVKRIQKNKLPGPMTPTLLRELNTVVANPDASFRDVGAVVAGHQVAAARLLTLANSAYYQRGGGKITTLEGAVRRLGLRETATILRAIAMRAYLVGNDKGMRGLIGEHLKRAFFVAQVASEIAQFRKHGAADEIYTIGLFFNIGAVFLLYTIALLQDSGRIGEVDIDGLQTAAQSRGAALNKTLARLMKLPDAVAYISAYEIPESPDPTQWSTVVGVIHSAIWAGEWLLDSPAKQIDLTPEAQLLGWDQPLVTHVNAQLERIQDMINKVFADVG